MRRLRHTLLRLFLSAALLAALFGAQRTHLHAAFDSPDLCATCSWSLHAPTTLSTPVALELEPPLVVAIVPSGADAPASRSGATARPRSPPAA